MVWSPMRSATAKACPGVHAAACSMLALRTSKRARRCSTRSSRLGRRHPEPRRALSASSRHLSSSAARSRGAVTRPLAPPGGLPLPDARGSLRSWRGLRREGDTCAASTILAQAGLFVVGVRARELDQLRRRRRCAPRGRLACSLVEGTGDLLARPSAPSARCRARSSGSLTASASRRCRCCRSAAADRRIGGRGKQRVAEADLAVRPARRRPPRPPARGQRVAEDRLGRPCQRRRCGDDARAPERASGAHARSPRASEAPAGDGRAGSVLPGLQGAHELQRVERVPARGLVNSDASPAV